MMLALGALAACNADREKKVWPFAVGQSSGVTVVTELPEAANRLRNATRDYGTFFVKDGCLQVRVGSTVLTPVLPLGSTLDARGDAIVVGGRRFPIGREYSLPFASEVGAGAGEAAASIGLPDRCSQRLLSMGSPG